jgi:hypothetical protein
MRWTKTVCALAAGLFLVSAIDAYAGDAFLKGGIQFKPSKDIEIKNRWLAAGGSDYRVTEDGPMFLGFELQFAKYSEGEGSTKISAAPFNVIANVKYKGPFEKVRPVAGIGAGMYSAWNWGTVGGFSMDRNWSGRSGGHIVVGLEYGETTKRGLLVELQIQRIFMGLPSADETQYLIMAGLFF